MGRRFVLEKSNVFHKGMTLIEILIVIAIVGALSAIAIPSYGEHLLRAERNSAKNDLYKLQVWVEQQFTRDNSYPAAIACPACQLSDQYTYEIDTSGSGNNIYVLKAVPAQGSRQVNDKCHSMLINAASETSNEKDGTSISSDGCWP